VTALQELGVSVENGVKKGGAGGADKQKKARKDKNVDMEKLADGLQKLTEDDLLHVVQLVHDNKTAETYTKNDVESELGLQSTMAQVGKVLIKLMQMVNSMSTSTRCRIRWSSSCGTSRQAKPSFEHTAIRYSRTTGQKTRFTHMYQGQDRAAICEDRMDGLSKLRSE
jgi:hypothetical protein